MKCYEIPIDLIQGHFPLNWLSIHRTISFETLAPVLKLEQFPKGDKISRKNLSVDDKLFFEFDALLSPLILLHHKVGVLYQDSSDKKLTEASLFENQSVEESEFWSFLHGIAKRISLENWQLYDGGLDTESKYEIYNI